MILCRFKIRFVIMTTDLPIDSSMIERWTNQWIRQLGFNDDQLLKRNHKVEQFTRVKSTLKRNSIDFCFHSVRFGSNQSEENG